MAPSKVQFGNNPAPFCFSSLDSILLIQISLPKGNTTKGSLEVEGRPRETLKHYFDSQRQIDFGEGVISNFELFLLALSRMVENQRRAFSEKAGQLWSPFFALLCQIFSVQSRAFKVSLMRFWKFMVGTALPCWFKILIFQRSNQNQSRWWYSFRHIIEGRR